MNADFLHYATFTVSRALMPLIFADFIDMLAAC